MEVTRNRREIPQISVVILRPFHRIVEPRSKQQIKESIPMQSQLGLDPNPIDDNSGTVQGVLESRHSNRNFTSVRLVVQCADCLKWRTVPTKEIYEAIRENINEEKFVCARAQDWQSGISCALPSEIYLDDGNFWAMDRHNIPQTPTGWQRLIRTRNENSQKFADIYYVTPTGKRLRSRAGVKKYLLDHPECTRNGVNISQFSFLIPKPLQ